MPSFALVIRNKNLRRFGAVLFSSIYLFAFFIATHFHHHNGGYFYKEFKFKNSTTNFSQQSDINNGDDCLSCHFSSTPVQLPETFKFSPKETSWAFSNSVLNCSKNAFSSHLSYFLRGPPHFI